MRGRRTTRALAASLLLVAVSLRPPPASGYTWQSIGPRGMTARGLAVDADPQVIYAAGPAGVSRSLDGGITWEGPSTFLPSAGSVFDVGADPSTPGTIYATGYDVGSCGIHCVSVSVVIAKSVNFGPWVYLYSETAENAFPGLSSFSRAAIAVDPTSPQTIHVAGWVRTVDGGATWTPVTGVPEGASAMVVDPTNPQVVYAAAGADEAFSGGIYKSIDGGATFASAGANLGNVVALDVSRDPTTGVLWITTGDGVFRSDDAAASWTPTASLPQRSVTVAARNGVVWVGTKGTKAPNPLVAGSVFRSFDDGATWQEWASGVPHLPVMGTTINDVVLSSTGVAWVGLDNFGVFWNDGPPDWQYPNNGVESRAVQRLVFDPTPPGTLWAATELGLYRSRNRGASWAPAMDGFGGPIAVPLAVDPFDPTTMFAAAARTPEFYSSAGLFRSSDSGSSWTAWNAGLGLGQADTLSIAFDPMTPGTVYLGHGVTGLSKSTNGGATWTNTSPSQFSAEWLLIDPSAPATLYAASTYYGVTKSIDGGTSWTAANTGIADTRVEALVLDPSDPQRLYANTAGSPPTITTADGAASWTPVPTMPLSSPQSIAVNPATSAVYVGGITGTVVEAPAGGATWSQVGDALPFDGVRTLALPPDGSVLFAGGADYFGGGVSWLQLTPCTTVADCDDGNGCTTDACEIPSGTCTYTTLADGTACTDVGGCGAGLCVGGACRPESCGTGCTGPDADGDGIADTCDPVDGTLAIRAAKITKNPTRASVSIKGTVVLGPNPDAVSSSTGMGLHVEAGGNPLASATWTSAECLVRSGGRFACTSADRLAKLKVMPSSKTPATPKLAAKIRGLAIPTVPAGPVDATLVETGRSITRDGAIATCEAKTSALVCRAP